MFAYLSTRRGVSSKIVSNRRPVDRPQQTRWIGCDACSGESCSYHVVVLFRLLTYNIHKAIGVDGRFDPDRVAAVLEHHDADIVLLQEVDRGAPRSGLIDLASYFAKRLNYDHRAVGMNVYLKKGRYGNATLTRFPIGRQRNINLTVAWRKRRGAQHTRISLNGMPPSRGGYSVDVFNLHLGLSALERRRQVRRLLECQDMRSIQQTDACIVAGDMNDWRGVLRRRHFLPADFVCATNPGEGSKWSIKTFPSYAPTGGLDKIFYRGPLRLLRVFRSEWPVATLASDHLPVIAEFEYFPRRPKDG